MKLEGVPDGYEAVRWGQPKKGEWFLDENEPLRATYDFEYHNNLIVRKTEPVLDLSKVRLKKGWIAQDRCGSNYWYEYKPELLLDDEEWGASTGPVRKMEFSVVTIPWRADVPWTERIMEIPE